jgi:hypothetical protein
MSEIVDDQPADRQIHVILDNYCTHKKNDDWLAAHPNVIFHFTPTSASWLNQVEIWFGIFTRKALAGASFGSAEQLRQAIQDFTTAYNEHASPFVWRKGGAVNATAARSRSPPDVDVAAAALEQTSRSRQSGTWFRSRIARPSR